jgi:hypothetical protein
MITLSLKEKKYIIILFFVSLLVRFAAYFFYLRHENRFWQVDSQTYHSVGSQLAQGKGFTNINGNDHFYRLPGYPIFIALAYTLFGPNKHAVLWAQIVLAAVIPMLIFLLSLVLFPLRRRLAIAAGLYSAFHLGLVLYASFFMSETLFIVFFLLFLLFFFASFHLWFCPYSQEESCKSNDQDAHDRILLSTMPRASMEVPGYEAFCQKIHDECSACVCDAEDIVTRRLVFAGLFLGVASLVRPVGHYVILVSILLLLFSNDGLLRKIAKVMALSVAWFFPVCLWLARNFFLTSHLFFHTLPGGHFLYLSASRVVSNVNHCSYQEARDQLRETIEHDIQEEEKAAGRPLLEIERCIKHEQLARTWFMQYPGISLQLWLTDICRTSLSLYSSEILYLEQGRPEIPYFDSGRTFTSLFKKYLVPKTDNFLLLLLIYYEILTFFLILLGFCGNIVRHVIRLLKRHKLSYTYLHDLDTSMQAIPIMILFIVLALAGGYARMRLPIEPLLIIFSLSGWGYFFAYIKKISHAGKS